MNSVRGVTDLFWGAWLVVNVAGCGSNEHSTSHGGSTSGGTTNTGGKTTNANPEAGAVVQSCDTLPPAGTWHNISPSEFATPSNMETLTVVVNPKDGTVYATAGNKTNGGTGGTGVLKSTDCGATWTLVSTGMHGMDLQTGNLWGMLIDPQEPQTLYVTDGYGSPPTLYKSTNGAVDWAELNTDPEHVVATGAPFVQAIAMDPFDHTHLAVTFHENCGAPYTPWCFSESNDGGTTWKTFNGATSAPGFTIDGWMESASISILGASSYLALSPEGIYFTADGGGTWTLVVAEIDYGGTTHLLPDGTLYIGNSAGPIYTSAPAPSHEPPFALYQAPTLPVPMPRLPFQSGLAPAVTALANSPEVTQIVDDGVNLFAIDESGQSPSFFSAPLANPTKWTQMPDKICVQDVCRGANELAVDPIHHIVYSANLGSGLWRLVTR